MLPVVPFAFMIKILDQEITDNCRCARIYNDITQKYTDMYSCFDRRKLALIT